MTAHLAVHGFVSTLYVLALAVSATAQDVHDGLVIASKAFHGFPQGFSIGVGLKISNGAQRALRGTGHDWSHGGEKA